MWNYKKEFSMSVVGVIITIILSLGGGIVVGNLTAPKEITYNVSQYQTQSQEQYLIDIEVENNSFESNINISIQAQTNVKVFTIKDGKTNHIAETNVFLPTWLPKFPRIE